MESERLSRYRGQCCVSLWLHFSLTVLEIVICSLVTYSVLNKMIYFHQDVKYDTFIFWVIFIPMFLIVILQMFFIIGLLLSMKLKKPREIVLRRAGCYQLMTGIMLFFAIIYSVSQILRFILGTYCDNWILGSTGLMVCYAIFFLCVSNFIDELERSSEDFNEIKNVMVLCKDGTVFDFLAAAPLA